MHSRIGKSGNPIPKSKKKKTIMKEFKSLEYLAKMLETIDDREQRVIRKRESAVKSKPEKKGRKPTSIKLSLLVRMIDKKYVTNFPVPLDDLFSNLSPKKQTVALRFRELLCERLMSGIDMDTSQKNVLSLNKPLCVNIVETPTL